MNYNEWKGAGFPLTVDGNLNIAGSAIKKLPDYLTVRGCIDLWGTAIKELPDNLTVEGKIHLPESMKNRGEKK